jgi:hypothetical protein
MNTSTLPAAGFRRPDDSGRAPGPDLAAMHTALATATQDGGEVIARMTREENLRFCRWEGQQANGRKPATIAGRPAEPWPGASDTRIFLTDSVITDQITMMRAAERRAKLTVRGTESADLGRAGKTQIYLDYLRQTKLAAPIGHEAALGASWRQTHGRALMAVTWRQEYARDHEHLTLAGLQQLAAQVPDSPVATLLASLYDPEPAVRTLLARQLVQLYPDLELAEAQRQLTRLATTGEMELPVRRLAINQPEWRALKPWVDVLYPLNTEDPQTAQWIAWRWTGNRAQVEEKAFSENWSPEFVEAVLKTEGATLLELRPDAGTARGDRVFADTAEQMRGLCEVFYFYYTHTDEQGVPCKYRTVFSPHVARGKGEDAALHGPDEPLGYAHGQFPFVALRRERCHRMLEETRSIPDIAGIAQQEIKALRDARIDQTELTMQPPTIRPEREIGLPLKIQPRGEIGERRAAATRAYPVPNTAPAGQPLEADAERDINRHFARNRGEDPVRAGLHDQVLADDWCAELAQCWTMTLQLAQQFEGDVTFSRVVGGKPTTFQVGREEIAGQFDLQLFFNTDVLDPEKMKGKTELLSKVLVPMDRFGVLNLAPVVAGLASYYFPEFADQMVQGVEQAGEKEIHDEQANWALMMAGERPQMHEDGQNFALRLNWLEQKTKEPGAQMRLASLPDSRSLVEERQAHLKFMTEQYTTNAQAGRVGVKPAASAAA